MSLDVPFNFDPVSTSQTVVSYSPGADEYAIASVTLNSTSAGNVTGGISGTGSFGATTDSATAVVKIELKPTDTLTITVTIATVSTLLAANAAGLVRDSCITELKVNGNTISLVRSNAAAWATDGGGGNTTISVDGTGDVRGHISVYNSIKAP